MSIHIYTRIYRHTNICIHSQTQKHVHKHTLTCHTCTWNYRHTNVSTHTHKRVDTHACAYTHINMHACGHVHPIWKYIHMHKHITKNTWRIHIHTYRCAHANTYAHKSYTWVAHCFLHTACTTPVIHFPVLGARPCFINSSYNSAQPAVSRKHTPPSFNLQR